jgi:hypothetical protein
MINATAKLKIISRGKTPLQHMQEITEAIHFELQDKLIDLAEQDKTRMQELIDSRGYKLNKLSNSINIEILNTTAGVDIGIGKISDLPKYWEYFNNGFKPGAHGKLIPLGSFEGDAPSPEKHGQKWEKGNGNFTFIDSNINKKVIEPILYVDIAGIELVNHINNEISNFLKNKV